MNARALVAAALGIVFAFTALPGAAFAGKPDDPGKSEQAPGQLMKAEKAADPAPAPAAEAKGQSEANGQSQAKGKSSAAPGHTKTQQAAAPSKGKSAQANANSEARGQARIQQNGEPGRSGEAHHHVIVCHRTGSSTNPYVVINIAMTAWSEAHSPDTGSHPTLDGRDDILLKDPASGPGTKDGFTKEDCGQPAAIQQQQEPLPQPAPKPEPQPEPAAAPQPAAGGVAGEQAVIAQPAAPAAPAAEQPAGGVLGGLGSVGAAELPFTGLPLWIAALAGIALVSAGLGARRAIR